MAANISTVFQIGTDNALIQAPQNYMVPANPPSTPNPPTSTSILTKTSTTTTSDTVTIYVSAIKGFNNPLALSFFIRKIDTRVDGTLAPADATTIPADGDALPITIGTAPDNMVSGVWDGVNLGWKGKIWMDAAHTVQATLTPNVGNALNTYASQAYRTLWINAQTTGSLINPNHPPSYQVNLYAFDTITNTYAACSFTLVVAPSLVNYGLGVKCIDLLNTTFINSVSVTPSGYADFAFHFYPLEPTYLNPADVTVTYTLLGKNTGDVDMSATLINTFPLSSYVPIVFPTGSLSRDYSAVEVDVHFAVTGGATVGDSILFQLIGTDSNKVSVSAYVIVQVVASV